MATLKDNKKLVADNSNSQKERPKNNFLRDANVNKVNEDYISQVFEGKKGGWWKSYFRRLGGQRVET